jgi:hypothetical protein
MMVPAAPTPLMVLHVKVANLVTGKVAVYQVRRHGDSNYEIAVPYTDSVAALLITAPLPTATLTSVPVLPYLRMVLAEQVAPLVKTFAPVADLVTGNRAHSQWNRRCMLTFLIAAPSTAFVEPVRFGAHLRTVTPNTAIARHPLPMAIAVQTMGGLLALGLASGRAVAPMVLAVPPRGVAWAVRWNMEAAKASQLGRIITALFW